MSKETELERLLVRLIGDGSSFQKMLIDAQVASKNTARNFDDLERRTKQWEETCEDAANTGEKLTASLGSMAGQIALAGGMITGLFGGIVTKGLMAAGQFEQTTIAFETMLGSADETTALLSSLTDFAAKTPFEMPEILQATRGLVQFGERGDDVLTTLNMLGNAASGTSTNFGMVALVFNQIRGVGRLLTQDFRQLSTRGILSLQDLAKHFDTTTKGAQEMLSGGKVSFEDTRAIFQGLSEEGGRFFNLMERQSQSFLGLTSTFKDAVNILFRKIGTELIPIAKWAVNVANQMVSVFDSMSPLVKKLIAGFLGLGSILGFVLTSFAGMVFIGLKVVGIYMAMSTYLTFYGIQLSIATAKQWAFNIATMAIPALIIAAKVAFLAAAAAALYWAATLAYEALPAIKKVNEELDKARSASAELTIVQLKLMKSFKKEVEETVDAQEKLDKIQSKLEEHDAKVVKLTETLKKANAERKTAAEFDHASSFMRDKAVTAAQEKSREALARLETAKGIQQELVDLEKEALKGVEKPEFISDLETQVALLGKKGMQLELAKLKMQGITDEHYFEAAALHNKIRLFKEEEAAKERSLKKEQEAKKSATDLTKAWDTQAATLTMSTRQAQIYRASLKGAPKELLDIARAADANLTKREEEIKLEKDAKSLKESLIDPAEKLVKETDKLEQMRSANLITTEEFNKAMEKLNKTTTDALKPLQAVAFGSSEFETMLQQASMGTREVDAAVAEAKGDKESSPSDFPVTKSFVSLDTTYVSVWERVATGVESMVAGLEDRPIVEFETLSLESGK